VHIPQRTIVVVVILLLAPACSCSTMLHKLVTQGGQHPLNRSRYYSACPPFQGVHTPLEQPHNLAQAPPPHTHTPLPPPMCHLLAHALKTHPQQRFCTALPAVDQMPGRLPSRSPRPPLHWQTTGCRNLGSHKPAHTFHTHACTAQHRTAWRSKGPYTVTAMTLCRYHTCDVDVAHADIGHAGGISLHPAYCPCRVRLAAAAMSPCPHRSAQPLTGCCFQP
jgi:hypothetical protein